MYKRQVLMQIGRYVLNDLENDLKTVAKEKEVAYNEFNTLIPVSYTHLDVYKRQELTIYKEGQVLTGAEVSENGTVFQYENRRQKSAVYNVYAGADIVTAYGTKVYSKGDLVKENLTTGENG